jgi:hypothetical protein
MPQAVMIALSSGRVVQTAPAGGSLVVAARRGLVLSYATQRIASR